MFENHQKGLIIFRLLLKGTKRYKKVHKGTKRYKKGTKYENAEMLKSETFYRDFQPLWAEYVNFKKWEHSFIGTPKSLWQFSVPISVASSSLRSRIFSFRSRRHFVQVPARGRSSPFHPGPFFSLLRVRAAGRTDLLQLSSTFRLISHAWRQ